jgi:hypothetical protein
MKEGRRIKYNNDKKREKNEERRRAKEPFSIMFSLLWFLPSILLTKSKTDLRNHIDEAA